MHQSDSVSAWDGADEVSGVLVMVRGGDKEGRAWRE
jgi:hypothetical protein